MSDQDWAEDERVPGLLHARGIPADASITVMRTSRSVRMRAPDRPMSSDETLILAVRLIRAWELVSCA